MRLRSAPGRSARWGTAPRRAPRVALAALAAAGSLSVAARGVGAPSGDGGRVFDGEREDWFREQARCLEEFAASWEADPWHPYRELPADLDEWYRLNAVCPQPGG